MNENREKNFISAVVYVHNNENDIQTFLERLHGVLDDNFLNFEIICVNDASSDRSADRIKSACDRFSGAPLSLIHMGHYHGLELSMNAGVDLAIGDFVFEFDTIDMDYDISLIMEVYTRSLTGFDIVGAAPKNRISGSSRFFYRLFNRNFDGPNKLRTERFRILSRRAINRVHSISKTIPYRKAIYASCGLAMDTLEYGNAANARRKSRDENRIRQSVAIDSLMLFTDVAFKFSITMAFLMIGFTVFMAVYALVFFIMGNAIEGWTTTMLFIAFGFFGLFGILAIVIKYLSLILDLIFKKEKYYIMSIEKISK